MVDPTFGLWDASNLGEKVAAVIVNRDPSGRWSVYKGSAPNGNMLAKRLVSLFRANVRYFAPERAPQSTWDNPEETLAPDSRNVVGVLERIKGTRRKFDRFVGLVRRVLPEVQDVSIVREGKAHLRVWFHDPESEAVSQAIGAHECGSGIRQVLGILSWVVEAEAQQILLLDEPQSYLHPAALRRLLDVIREANVGQCVLATHAIETVNRPDVAGIVHLELVDARTRATAVRLSEVSALRGLMDSVGARPGDAYAAEAVLWVEGPSEVGVFRAIIEHRGLGWSLSGGLAVLPVAHACKVSGKAKGSNVEEILAIYERVAGVDALLPRTCGFIFDHDGRPAEDRRRLYDRRKGRITFTQRRMLENYLLQADSITETIASHFAVDEIDVERVRAIVAKMLSEVNIHEADGAAVMREIFNAASESRLSYDKVSHAPMMARRMMEKDPSSLNELWTAAESVIEGKAPRP